MTEREYLKGLGDRIRAARIKKGISVLALSKLCEMDFSIMSHIQCGQTNTKILTLKRIANALDVNIKELI
jgi:transcriptional regulator with XRE-family HTH domain